MRGRWNKGDMFRFALISGGLLAVASCVATQNVQFIPLDEAFERAQAEAKVRQSALDYASFAKARYASLTDDPMVAALNYAQIADGNETDAELAERAVFSALLIGQVEKAIDISRRLDDDVLSESDLPRLTLAVEALRRSQNKKAVSYFNSPWQGRFHRVIANSLTAWTALENDPDAAIRLQAIAGDGDVVMSGVAGNLAAIMQAGRGEDRKSVV